MARGKLCSLNTTHSEKWVLLIVSNVHWIIFVVSIVHWVLYILMSIVQWVLLMVSIFTEYHSWCVLFIEYHSWWIMFTASSTGLPNHFVFLYIFFFNLSSIYISKLIFLWMTLTANMCFIYSKRVNVYLNILNIDIWYKFYFTSIMTISMRKTQ